MQTLEEQRIETPSSTDEASPRGDVQPTRDDPDWLLVGYGSCTLDADLKVFKPNGARFGELADVRVSDVAQIAGAAQLFRERWKARNRFPVIWLRPWLAEQFTAAVDAMTVAEAGEDGRPHSESDDIELLPFHMTHRPRGAIIEAWDTLLIGWPGEPGSTHPDDAEQPSETLGGERFLRQPKVPPLGDLRGRLCQYAAKQWDTAWKHYRVHGDDSAAVTMLVPPVKELKRWTKDLRIEPVETPAPEPKSPATKVGDTALDHAIMTVYDRAERKGIRLSQDQVRKQVRKAGGEGNDAKISNAWKKYVAEQQ